uniref:Uncharacterized protein n=1 Tax=Populus trichocarpa TaxID=3694 RepID=A0A3N7FLV5_POPTR
MSQNSHKNSISTTNQTWRSPSTYRQKVTEPVHTC